MNDTSKSLSSAHRFAENGITNNTRRKAKNTIRTGVAIAYLLKMATKLALEGIRSLLPEGRGRAKEDNSLLEDITDRFSSGKRKSLGKSKNFTQRLGNKVRGISRGAKNARKLKAASKVGTVAKVGRFGKTLNNVKKMGTAVKTLKMAKTGKNVYTAAKLANFGRISATGGLALAGGPVGIGLMVGSVVAPYAIEAVWKNREKIYEGSKDLVTKSKVMTADIAGLVKGKNAQPGEIVPEAKGLKVTKAGQQTLLEVDDEGKVLANNFSPEDKLTFYQGNDGERSLLVDEAQIANTQANTSQESQTGKQSGTSIVGQSLSKLAQNNPDNPQIQGEAQYLGNSLGAANSLTTQTPGKNAVALNEAGSSVINLFNSHLEPGKRNQTLETQNFTISRRGNDYFLKDKEGNNLLQATNTGFGTKIKSSNLKPQQMEELNYLKQDLRLNQGITGGFEPIGLIKTNGKTAQAQAPEPTVQTQAPESVADKEPVAQASGQKINSARVQSSNSRSPHLPPPPPSSLPKQEKPTSAFSQYMNKEENNLVASGNSKGKDMER